MIKRLFLTLIIVVTVTATAMGQMSIYMWWKASEAAFSDNGDEGGFHEIGGATDFNIMLISSDISRVPHSYFLTCSYKDRNGVSQTAFNAYVDDEPSTHNGTIHYWGFTFDEQGRPNQGVDLVINEDGIVYIEEKTRFAAVLQGCKKVDWAN